MLLNNNILHIYILHACFLMFVFLHKICDLSKKDKQAEIMEEISSSPAVSITSSVSGIISQTDADIGELLQWDGIPDGKNVTCFYIDPTTSEDGMSLDSVHGTKQVFC